MPNRHHPQLPNPKSPIRFHLHRRPLPLLVSLPLPLSLPLLMSLPLPVLPRHPDPRAQRRGRIPEFVVASAVFVVALASVFVLRRHPRAKRRIPAFRLCLRSSSPNPKNKLQNPVLFFSLEKVTVTSPRLPRIPPQTHHKNTTLKTRISAKNPAKSPLHHKRKKRPGNRRTAHF
jgi:hypothetical protein